MSILRLLLQTSIAGHRSSRGQTLDREDGCQLLAVSLQEMMPLSLKEFTTWQQIYLLKLESFGARNDAIVIRGVYDEAKDTSAEARKMESKLDALVNLGTQLAVSQKPASIARVCHHSSRGQTLDREDDFKLLAVSVQEMMPLSLEEFTTWLQIHLLKLESFGARNDVIAIREVYDVATDTSAETRKVEDKIDALVNLVTQLAVNQRSASVARVYGIRSTNDHHTNVEGKLDALVNLVSQLAVNQKPASVARATTAAEARHLIEKMVEGKLDALVNFVTQLVVNQKPTSVRPGVNEHPEAYAANIYSRPPQQEVYDVSTDTSAETRKVEGKLDALVNLVTQPAVNQKPASVARVCGIRSTNDHHTNVCPSSFGARNDVIVIRGAHDVATDTSAKTRKVEGKLDAIMNLVTQLAVNQKPASVARVCGIRSSNDHHTNVCPSSLQPGVNEHPEAYATCIYSRPPQQHRHLLFHHIVIRGVHDVATDTSAKTRKVEGKLDALVTLVTQLVVNQKSASVARVCGIRSSNDQHTNVCHQSRRGQTLDREDSIQLLAVSVQKMMSLSLEEFTTWLQMHLLKLERCHHSSRGQTLDREDGFQILVVSVQEMLPLSLEEFNTWLQIHLLKLESFAAKNDAIVISGVHDVSIDTSAETRKVEGKLDDLVDLVIQLAVNQKPASVPRASTAAEAKHLIEKMNSNS
ncbi:hypothetical protein Fmac_024831 [Flemingia macrophylla]|uniref:Uncharacterized protein n=1 Tax=Flemingia macrophylla TaxID=520843 RepID=A0ABD1LR44_9FABA